MSQNLKFSSGDVVRLKSGGLKMTVSEYNGSWVQCWYVKKAKPMAVLIPQDVLEKCDP